MTAALAVLLPLILASAGLGVGALILAALVGKWRKWPEPDAWESRIGRVEPRK
jgi:hypothetical protein